MTEEIIDIMTAAEAAEWLRSRGMRITPDTLRVGIEQGAFPFGSLVRLDKTPRCFVYTRLLEDWAAQRYRRVPDLDT